MPSWVDQDEHVPLMKRVRDLGLSQGAREAVVDAPVAEVTEVVEVLEVCAVSHPGALSYIRHVRTSDDPHNHQGIAGVIGLLYSVADRWDHPDVSLTALAEGAYRLLLLGYVSQVPDSVACARWVYRAIRGLVEPVASQCEARRFNGGLDEETYRRFVAPELTTAQQAQHHWFQRGKLG